MLQEQASGRLSRVLCRLLLAAVPSATRCCCIVHADARGLCLLCWGMLARTDRTRADLNKVSNAKRIAKLVRLCVSGRRCPAGGG